MPRIREEIDYDRLALCVQRARDRIDQEAFRLPRDEVTADTFLTAGEKSAAGQTKGPSSGVSLRESAQTLSFLA
jgi:hypothetical protein